MRQERLEEQVSGLSSQGVIHSKSNETPQSQVCSLRPSGMDLGLRVANIPQAFTSHEVPGSVWSASFLFLLLCLVKRGSPEAGLV